MGKKSELVDSGLGVRSHELVSKVGYCENVRRYNLLELFSKQSLLFRELVGNHIIFFFRSLVSIISSYTVHAQLFSSILRKPLVLKRLFDSLLYSQLYPFFIPLRGTLIFLRLKKFTSMVSNS